MNGGLDKKDPGISYEYWTRLRDRGVAIIMTKPLRLFYLHDLIYWMDLKRR